MSEEGQESELAIVGETADVADTEGEYETRRKRTPTEKGKEWQLQLLKGEFRTCASLWKKEVNSLSVLLSDCVKCDEIRLARSKLDSCFSELSEVCRKFDGYEPDEVTDIFNKFEFIENEHMRIMTSASETIRSIELEAGSARLSKHSGASVRSTSSKRADAASKVASLRAKLRFINAEAKAKAELERIETFRKLEMASAAADVFNQMDPFSDFTVQKVEQLPQSDKYQFVDQYIQSQSEKIVSPNVDSGGLDTDANVVERHATRTADLIDHSAESVKGQNPTPLDPLSGTIPKQLHETDSDGNSSCWDTRTSRSDPAQTINQNLIELAKVLADQVSLNRLPPPEPNIFNGDPLQYPAWKTAFKTLIDQRNIPRGERIHYLKRYVGSQVRQVIENYLLVPSDDAYEKAKELLEERYGDPFVVASAFRDKIDSWPKVQTRDAMALLRLSDFLKQCLAAMETTPGLQILNDCHENRKLLSKLPDWLVTRWNRIVSCHKQEKGEFPSFKLFVEFVGKESKIASDPVTSVHSLKESHGSDHKGSQSAKFSKGLREGHRPSGRSFLSGSHDKSSTSDCDSNTNPEDVCILCKGSHDLDDCKLFGKKTMSERKAYAREKGLCFACLHSGHISRRCRQRKKCKVCSKLHPTSFHGDRADSAVRKGNTHASNSFSRSERVNTGVTFLSDTGVESKCSAIVPVYVSHVGNPNQERLVYALLDSQSDTTFVLQKTSDVLGVPGTPVKLSLSTMLSEDKVVNSHKVKGLVVRGYDSCESLPLPDAYTRNIMPANRSHIPTPETARAWPHLEHIASSLMPLDSCEIGLLIGYNCSRALLPREVIPPVGDGPFGQRTDLGWSIVGVVRHGDVEEDTIGVSHRLLAHEVHSDLVGSTENCAHSVLFSLRTEVKEVVSSDVLRLMERDFDDPVSNGVCPLSVEDQLFLSEMGKGIKVVEGKYEMPLPFKGSKPPVLPCNRSYAIKRVRNLQKRLIGDEKFRQHYSQFMCELLKKGHAERVDQQIVDDSVWYIPHHGVYHPQKPDKIRVVFDCSATFQGRSLNQHLLQGPDLTNKLVGVLSRFRKEPVAVICDIEQMFYQFKVSPECRNYLRFLWWDTNDYSLDPVDYRMTVHLFGATSSPGCANFGLKQVARDYEAEYGKDASKFIDRDFYVDDGLKSLPTACEAVDLLDRTRAMCSRAGLRLHKFVSNSKEVLQSLDPTDLAKDLKNVDLTSDKLPVERALGISWCVESDTFQFKIVLKDRPLTRRGILSSVGCLYDPLGLIAPVVLQGKQILQQMCADKSDWDDPLPENLHSQWQQWREGLEHLSSLQIGRCLKPENFGEVAAVELHHFSDASSVGYGQCSYSRLISIEGDIHCSLLMGKSRVVPLKPITIPRLELTAAVLSIKAGNLLQQELDFDKVEHIYWTDSKVVLGYISNECRRFHVFVANRVQQIRNYSEPAQWNYVGTNENPADIASRGAQTKNLVKSSLWFNGPDFLWHQELPQEETKIQLDLSDPEVKKSVSFHVDKGPPPFPSILKRLEKFSSWHKAKVAVALCLRLKTKLLHGKVKKPKDVSIVHSKAAILRHEPVTVVELHKAEIEICKVAQANSFTDELKQLKAGAIVGMPVDRQEATRRRVKLRASSRFCGLDPFLDDSGIIRVGGRIQNANISSPVKHPIVLPRKSHISELLVRYFHEQSLHQGRGITTNAIRQNGFWILGCSSLVSSVLAKCVVCRKLRAFVQEQKMAELPSDRLEPSPPFTYCAVDLFGPFYVREGRKELKRYGVLFTCMACRAVHVETVNSLETDSFINCLRRFIAVRGPMRQLRSDRGTNFVGAENELKQALNELDDERIHQFLLEQGCDFFNFKMNVPAASHMGGVWERQIRSIRGVLAFLLQTHGSLLDDESLRTFLSEAAAIINCRPLTVENLNDPKSLTPLTPNQLLTLKSKVILPPPGNFQREDLYLRKRWRRTQYLIDQFWSRWKVEFLQNLQVRNKWLLPKRNMQVGDVVILKEDNMPRNQWRLGKLVETTVDDDGLVRKVKVAMADSCLDSKGKRKSPVTILERPIQKLVLLQESEEIPDREP